MRKAVSRTAARSAGLLRTSETAWQQGLLPFVNAVNIPQTPALIGTQLQQQRGLQILELFSQEARAKRRQRLKEDLQRGYFDDFKELKDTGGKLWRAPDRIIPADAARPFPSFQVASRDQASAQFPRSPEFARAASLVCVGFKDGSEEMLASWSKPFAERFRGAADAALVELSVVESQVMALWPFRSMIMRAAASRTAAAGASTVSAAADPPGSGGAVAAAAEAADVMQTADRLRLEYLFYFGDAYDLCKDAQITNRLTGYVFLLDVQGRVRFRGCGTAAVAEMSALLRAAGQLLDAG